jgi:hypothetical protein
MSRTCRSWHRAPMAADPGRSIRNWAAIQASLTPAGVARASRAGSCRTAQAPRRLLARFQALPLKSLRGAPNCIDDIALRRGRRAALERRVGTILHLQLDLLSDGLALQDGAKRRPKSMPAVTPRRSPGFRRPPPVPPQDRPNSASSGRLSQWVVAR